MKRKFINFSGIFITLILLLSGCNDVKKTPLSYYDSTEYKEGEIGAHFNNNLFYRNDRRTDVADPAVFYISDEDSSEYGYYYMVGTTTARTIECFRSKTLEVWENMGVCLDNMDKTTDEGNAVDFNVWAPEVIYDETDGKYYMFLSGTPTNWKGAEVHLYLPYMAVADEPYGPYKLIDRSNDYEPIDDSIIPNHYYNKFLAFDPMKMYRLMEEKGIDLFGSPYMRAIDFHPFVDPVSGEKYLYFVNNKGYMTYICAMKMNTWTDPDYSTFTFITKTRYETPTSDKQMSYEDNNYINEGPWVIYRNGIYYLTLSINGYGDRSYSVIQAISDSPLGEFRKLSEDEGGILLSADGMAMDHISGTGHHSLIERDGQYYIIYHAHNSVELGGGPRHVMIDRVEWITITKEDGSTLDVMYTNGPTKAIQPRFEFNSEYVNIAPEATITATNVLEGSSTSYLNDKLLSIYRFANPDFIDKYVRETEFEGNTTITLTFDEYKPVRAIMIYNSKLKENAFYEIKRVEFDTKNDKGHHEIMYIDNLAFDWTAASSRDDIDVIRGGHAAIAEFYEMQVKTIRISIDIPTYEQIDIASGIVGVGEIVVLGRKV